MEHDRLNSPSTSVIELEVMGHHLHFSQDPNSQHLGTTVWDASMVLARQLGALLSETLCKYSTERRTSIPILFIFVYMIEEWEGFIERNCRRGRFIPSRLKGKRVIEVGAGCGVAGFGMALLGCDVVTTDQKVVLPLLNYFGSIKVAELDWGNDDHIRAVGPPFDYIIGTDVVYAEHLLELLLKTFFSVSGPKTTILVGHEIRSTAVHEQMLDMWKKHFEVKSIPKSKMDAKYQHPSIQLYIMSAKPQTGSNGILQQIEDTKTGETSRINDAKIAETPQIVDGIANTNYLEDDKALEEHILEKLRLGQLSDWETRRYGSMAARLTKDIKIS